ncbi:hypothetical protein ACFV5G_31200 [Streptomyces sp. NPDC059766]|uniref:hypothetical protein n=1 Tax=Streptomyces sp. NPDC059766 TaxID=3346940 RepID=UPI00365D18D6
MDQRSEEWLDQIVFRWEGNRDRNGTGITAVAYSCVGERAEELREELAPLLRVEGSERPSQVRQLSRSGDVVVVNRRSGLDAHGRTSTESHALVGGRTVLKPRFCLTLSELPVPAAGLAGADLRGLRQVAPGAFDETAEREWRRFSARVGTVARPLTVVTAQLLRTPERLMSVRIPDFSATGANETPLLVWGLCGIFGDWLGQDYWTYATCDTSDTHGLRVVGVPAWRRSATEDARVERITLGNAPRDEADAVARELVRLFVSDPDYPADLRALFKQVPLEGELPAPERLLALGRLLGTARGPRHRPTAPTIGPSPTPTPMPAPAPTSAPPAAPAEQTGLTEPVHGPLAEPVHGPGAEPVHGPGAERFQGARPEPVHGPGGEPIQGPRPGPGLAPGSGAEPELAPGSGAAPGSGPESGPGPGAGPGPETVRGPEPGPGPEPVRGPDSVRGPAAKTAHGPVVQAYGPVGGRVGGPVGRGTGTAAGRSPDPADPYAGAHHPTFPGARRPDTGTTGGPGPAHGTDGYAGPDDASGAGADAGPYRDQPYGHQRERRPRLQPHSAPATGRTRSTPAQEPTSATAPPPSRPVPSARPATDDTRPPHTWQQPHTRQQPYAQPQSHPRAHGPAPAEGPQQATREQSPVQSPDGRPPWPTGYHWALPELPTRGMRLARRLGLGRRRHESRTSSSGGLDGMPDSELLERLAKQDVPREEADRMLAALAAKAGRRTLREADRVCRRLLKHKLFLRHRRTAAAGEPGEHEDHLTAETAVWLLHWAVLPYAGHRGIRDGLVLLFRRLCEQGGPVEHRFLELLLDSPVHGMPKLPDQVWYELVRHLRKAPGEASREAVHQSPGPSAPVVARRTTTGDGHRADSSDDRWLICFLAVSCAAVVLLLLLIDRW